MDMKTYDDIGEIGLDVLREVDSIGIGNAATAIAALTNSDVNITLPGIEFLEFGDTTDALGNPEEIVASVLVQMSGDMKGIMLFLFQLDFVNAVIKASLNHQVEDYGQLDQMDISALTEVGNILISSYVNALAQLADMEINLSVPAVSINMLGGILSVPMIELGYETDRIMMISGNFIMGEQHLKSSLLMLPDAKSLNHLLEKLVKKSE